MARGPMVTAEERQEIYRRLRAGERVTVIATAIGRKPPLVHHVLRQTGGLRPRPAVRSPRRLSLAEREEISRGLGAGESLRSIARRLARAPSTISRETGRNGGQRRYRAWRAEQAAARRARRPKPAKLARNGRLRLEVERLLARRWSPQQISAWLRLEHPSEPEWWVAPETIYESLYVQGRGALRRELTRYLRTGRAQRRPHGRHAVGGHLRDMILISDRPAEVEDRAVPGHWEGDLIVGPAARSAIGTLVERQTRFVMLVALPNGHTASEVRDGLARQIRTLPAELRRTLTWDRGSEMAEHVRFSVETGVAVYFCNPHSPWQRGTNENTNGLLRGYFPKGTDLAVHGQADLDAVAAELNDRPRQTLGWMKPSQAFARLVATTD